MFGLGVDIYETKQMTKNLMLRDYMLYIGAFSGSDFIFIIIV
jgi:hypothetical protein